MEIVSINIVISPAYEDIWSLAGFDLVASQFVLTCITTAITSSVD